jgi:Leu/Phe-tRNA-protein transferase
MDFGPLAYFARAINILFVVVGLGVYSPHARAHQPQPTPSSSACASGLAEFPPALSGLGYRGFVTAKPAFTAESFIKAQEHLILEWSTEIYVVPSLEEAIAHDASDKKLIDRGFYILGDEDLSKVPENQIAEVFSQLAQRGVYFFVSGETKRVPQEYLDTRFDLSPEKLRISRKTKVIDGEIVDRGWAFVQRGWFYPIRRGIIHYHDTINSSTYKELRKTAKKLYEKGFRVRFNTNFELGLKMLEEQKRKGQSDDFNRFSDPQVLAAMRALHREGRAFFSELWDEKGDLVAGSLILKSGAIYSPDSVFYTRIDYAKVVALAEVERFYQGGVHWQDLQTVSPFSALLKARFIPVAQFEELRRMQKEGNPDFETDWSPFEHERIVIVSSPSYDLIGPPQTR